MTDQTHVTWHDHQVQRRRGCVVWFTGLSGSGKSTIANAVDAQLHAAQVLSFILDGDNVRHGLNASRELLLPVYGADFAERFGLGFSPQDRQENIRRIGAVGELFCSAGFVALTAFVSPYRRDRELVRQYVERMGAAGEFVEVFVDTPLEICEQRDPKKLYQQAREGKLTGFTGIDAPYEPPENPEIVLAGDSATPDELANQVVDYLKSAGNLPE